ncbi:MAG: hypothetical protein VX223_16070, partial [Myxococcota bacterium]|nr:hypothetical protein [Myxococcota bacterium]
MKCMRYALRFTCILAALSSVLVSSGCPNSNDNTGPVLTTDVADTTSPIDVEVPPPALACESANDCLELDGTGLCTIAICDPIVGQCRLHSLPNCCERDEDCDDGDPVTDDTCNTDLSVCQWTYPNTPCQVDLDCDTGESCIYFECDSVCSYWKKPNCCTSAKDCDDGDLCTVEECDNFSCIRSPSESPICCGDILESYPLNTGLAPSLDVQTNGEVVRWQASQRRWRSPPSAAYFGDTTTDTYENPVKPDGSQAASKGTLLTAPIAFPAAGATLRFSVWVDVETELDWDLFEVFLIPSVGSDQVIWSKSELDPQSDYRTWIDVEVDLASYAGTTARLGFTVDTVDATVNTGEGIYLDDIAIFSPCVAPPIPCVSDADCDDSNACTDGSCASDGTCTFQPVESCCATVEDCPATTSVCETALCVENACVIEVKDSCCGPETQCPELECRVAACDLSNNACIYSDIPDCCVAGTGAVLCDDEDPCTQDTCEENQCVNNPVSDCVPCETDAECADQDPCTADTCSQSKCSNVVLSNCLACDTSSDCPISDDICEVPICLEGACAVETAPTCIPCFSSVGCDDDDPCTTDSCVDGTCEFTVIPGCIVQCTSGSDCDDANPCTIDACNQGQCINGPI